MAEAVLREIPAVLGASVHEDINGHPREVHLLVSSGQNPRELSRDVRTLLQDRLGVHVDQRVISIAQLSNNLDRMPTDLIAERVTTQSDFTPESYAPGADHWPASTAGLSPETTRFTSANAAPPDPGRASAGPETRSEMRGKVPRVIYQGVESSTRGGRVEVRVRLTWRDQEYLGEESEIDGELGRIRATATATLRAADLATAGKIRFDLESALITRALGREYILITILAASPVIGRRPLTLVGAQPLEFDAEMTAALATLQAINRTLPLALVEKDGLNGA
jgi:hypothetical protein